MTIDWNDLKRIISPVKDFTEIYKRLHASFEYPFVRRTFNFTLPQLSKYCADLLGGDAQNRYTEYLAYLDACLTACSRAGIRDVLGVIEIVKTSQSLEDFCSTPGIVAKDIITLTKFFIYWFVPMGKPLIGLIRDDPQASAALSALREAGIRTNLDMLQKGLTPSARKTLAATCKVSPGVIENLVNRADFSRMPWASKATISNLMGAGCATLAQLAAADPQTLYPSFYAYGKSMGRNLKFGNEIENSYRIAKLVPPILEPD